MSRVVYSFTRRFFLTSCLCCVAFWISQQHFWWFFNAGDQCVELNSAKHVHNKVDKLYFKNRSIFSKIELFNKHILERLKYDLAQEKQLRGKCNNMTVDDTWCYAKARGFVYLINEDDVNPRTLGTVDWFNQQTLTSTSPSFTRLSATASVDIFKEMPFYNVNKPVYGVKTLILSSLHRKGDRLIDMDLLATEYYQCYVSPAVRVGGNWTNTSGSSSSSRFFIVPRSTCVSPLAAMMLRKIDQAAVYQQVAAIWRWSWIIAVKMWGYALSTLPSHRMPPSSMHGLSLRWMKPMTTRPL